ncbi:MAG TPA: hypothetical protein VHR27_01575 [Blastocatellia bacterium]|jgi:hypothetical protein|nr:hypothetical protein [Blastocatellia bacterium]
MKRSILVVLVFLLTVSVSGLAQQPNLAETVYNKWKQGATADEVSRTHFAMAAVTRRTGEEVAEVDLWVVGRTQEAVIDVQPMYVEKLPNGENRQEQAGAVTTTSVANSDSGSDARDNLGLKVMVPVRSNANALTIKWVGYAGGKMQNSHTIQVRLLRDEPSESFSRITLSKKQ